MNLTGIIAIAGKPGLYKVLSRAKNGLVVENLIDGKKMPALATHKISALEDISMYTYGEDIRLGDVVKKMYDYTKGEEVIDPKSDGAVLFDYFGKVVPEFDKDRVYVSDVKKLFVWYNLLVQSGLLNELNSALIASEADGIEDAVIVEENKTEE